MATTDDWENAEKRAARWLLAEKRAAAGDINCQCLLNLRRRVEALEQRATPAPEPAPAPAADRPLWEVMQQAWRDSETVEFSVAHRYAAEIDAVAARSYAAEIDAAADWLDARGCMDAGDLLRAEARRAREGA